MSELQFFNELLQFAVHYRRIGSDAVMGCPETQHGLAVPYVDLDEIVRAERESYCGDLAVGIALNFWLFDTNLDIHYLSLHLRKALILVSG